MDRARPAFGSTVSAAPLAGSRGPLTVLELLAKASGARYPVTAARGIGPDCPDVPAALAALRQRKPSWFEPGPPR